MNIYKCGTQVEIYSAQYKGIITGQQVFDSCVIYEIAYKTDEGNKIVYMEENGFKVIDGSKPLQTIK
jgi:hypothetical protein